MLWERDRFKVIQHKVAEFGLWWYLDGVWVLYGTYFTWRGAKREAKWIIKNRRKHNREAEIQKYLNKNPHKMHDTPEKVC